MNRRLADFEARLERTGKAQLIRDASAKVANQLRQRRSRRSRQTDEGRQPVENLLSTEKGSGIWRARWANTWRGDLEQTEEAMIRDWARRWERDLNGARTQRPNRGDVPADIVYFDQEDASLDKYRGLPKHESSLLIQIRTGKIGLRAFLFGRKVPDVLTPLCRCGDAPETPLHLAIDCVELTDRRAQLRTKIAPRALRTRRDFTHLTEDPDTARTVVRWMLDTGRFPQFRLAEEVAKEERESGEDTAVMYV